jgi:hypothetical protein
MHISKEGDPYLRTLLVQGAQPILLPFGVDCDLRRWGLKLAERGGRNGKKRAIVATARKLAVLLHLLWVSGEVYEPLHKRSRTTGGSRVKQKDKPKSKPFQEEERQEPKPSSVDRVNRLARVYSPRAESQGENQMAAPAETRTPNVHRANQNRSSRVRMRAWRQWPTRRERKPCSAKPEKNPLDSDRPSHGRRLH